MKYVIGALRKAFPLLDYYLELGAVMHALSAASVRREDVQVALVGGRIYIGYADEPWQGAECICGTFGIEPTADDWMRAVLYVAERPRARAHVEGRNVA